MNLLEFYRGLPAVSLVLGVCLLAQQPRPRVPSIQLTPEERTEIQSRVDKLQAAVQALRSRRADPALLADVEIFHKAGAWLLEFPEHLFVRDDYTNALSALDLGLQRAGQLEAGQAPWIKETGRRLHGFHSDLDGSVQLYGVRVPDSYDGTKPVRLYVWLHGRDQRLTETNFISRFQKVTPAHSNPADEGQIQLDVYGRWNGMAFHIVGEADVFEAIADVRKRYKIDPDRILLRGFSMGGCGAWHIALHHPGFFAAAEIGAGTWPRRSQMPGFPPYQQGPLRIWENINDWALNAFNLPLAGHGGENETGTSSIPLAPPGTPTRGQLESSIKIRQQLEREGYASEGDPYELRAKGTEAVFLISKDTGHSTSPHVRAKLDAFLKKYGDRGRVSPDHIRFLTYTTRYNSSHWVTADRLQKHYERSEVEAKRSQGGKQYEITTRNITRLTLRETGAAGQIVIDGQSMKVKPAPELAFEKAASGWSVAKGGKASGLFKTHALQGPIDDAFLDPFLLVRPTGYSLESGGSGAGLAHAGPVRPALCQKSSRPSARERRQRRDQRGLCQVQHRPVRRSGKQSLDREAERQASGTLDAGKRRVWIAELRCGGPPAGSGLSQSVKPGSLCCDQHRPDH